MTEYVATFTPYNGRYFKWYVTFTQGTARLSGSFHARSRQQAERKADRWVRRWKKRDLRFNEQEVKTYD